jgi:3D (Asp-Asp-Asp) domain-containing protein
MRFALRSQLAFLTAVGVGISSVWGFQPAQAIQFDAAEVNQSRFVIIASPIGQTQTYKLVIFEQLNNQRLCWQEVGNAPTQIDPLFLQFDFTGICGRSTDSNGYSVRTSGQDLAGRYNLRIARRQNELVLLAFSFTEKNAEFFEIGRTQGLADGYLKIQLDPGWRLTRRMFQGKSAGHLYLTSDRSYLELAALEQAKKGVPQTPMAPSTRPSAPVTPTPSLPASDSTLPPATVEPSAKPQPSWPSGYSSPTPITVPTPAPTPSGTPAPFPVAPLPPSPPPSDPLPSTPLPPSEPAPQNRPQGVVVPILPVEAPPAPTGTGVAPTGTGSGVKRLSPQSWQGDRFNFPASTRAALGQPKSLWATYYYTHQAQQVVNGTPLFDRDNNYLGINLSEKDWCAAALQGSVQISAGSQILGTYNYHGRGEQDQVNCAPYYPKLKNISATNRVRFRYSPTPYGEGVGGYSLVPYRTIAVDKTVIPIGSVVYIPEARGTRVTLPSGQRVIHDGYFYAADAGHAIQGNHIDVFLGITKQNPFSFVKSKATSTFKAYIVNDPNIQAMFQAQHRFGNLTAMVSP